MTNKLWIIAALAVLALAGIWYAGFRRGAGVPAVSGGGDVSRSGDPALAGKAAPVETAKAAAGTGAVKRAGISSEDIAKLGEGRLITSRGFVHFLPTDEAGKATSMLDSLLDDDRRADALAEAMRLKEHHDAEVRSKAAFAFKWLGIEGLEGLTSMLNDPDPDVAQEASGYWKDQLGELDSGDDKASLLVAAAQVYGDNVPTDVLEDIVAELQMLEDRNTIDGLTEILKGLSSPEKIEIVGDAINGMADQDQPELTKEQRLKQAERVAGKIQAQEIGDAISQDDNEPSTGIVIIDPVMGRAVPVK